MPLNKDQALDASIKGIAALASTAKLLGIDPTGPGLVDLSDMALMCDTVLLRQVLLAASEDQRRAYLNRYIEALETSLGLVLQQAGLPERVRIVTVLPRQKPPAD